MQTKNKRQGRSVGGISASREINAARIISPIRSVAKGWKEEARKGIKGKEHGDIRCEGRKKRQDRING